jgi:2-polyprenyl-3-methyl-5-hydroxy-6-metoxy-1,4-benzoquinol methylase
VIADSPPSESAGAAPRRVDRCPLCAADGDPAFVARDRNREISPLPFPYARCRDCATLWLTEVPTDLGRYYPEAYYELPAAADLPKLAAGEQAKVDLIAAQTAPGRLVEIGPGFGVFAFAAKRAGHTVTGIEMDARCCAYLRDTVGVEAINSAEPETVLAGLEPSRVIALWHVIEHVPAPGALLDAIAANLEPGGVAVIATPNPEALQFRLLKERWAHVDAPRHLSLMPLDALSARASRAGLRLAGLTLRDPAGRHWNRFGWEYALRRRPAGGPAGPVVNLAGIAAAQLLRPLEGRGRNGAAYTAVFRKEAT